MFPRGKRSVLFQFRLERRTAVNARRAQEDDPNASVLPGRLKQVHRAHDVRLDHRSQLFGLPCAPKGSDRRPVHDRAWPVAVDYMLEPRGVSDITRLEHDPAAHSMPIPHQQRGRMTKVGRHDGVAKVSQMGDESRPHETRGTRHDHGPLVIARRHGCLLLAIDAAVEPCRSDLTLGLKRAAATQVLRPCRVPWRTRRP